MTSAISYDYLPRSEGRSAGGSHSAIASEASRESRRAEQWRRAWRAIAAEFVCEISGYDVRRYLTEDVGPSTVCH